MRQSSKREHECQGKVAHPTRLDAMFVRAQMAIRHEKAELLFLLHPYCCSWCLHWHLGTVSRPAGARRYADEQEQEGRQRALSRQSQRVTA